jgi:hypothetical protein
MLGRMSNEPPAAPQRPGLRRGTKIAIVVIVLAVVAVFVARAISTGEQLRKYRDAPSHRDAGSDAP